MSREIAVQGAGAMARLVPPISRPGVTFQAISASSSRPSRAFSLVELMVVIAVVTILTGLLMPALTHVRENARRMVCASNLHNIGLGMQIYFDENGSRYPYTAYGQPGHALFNPQEMMSSYRGADSATIAHQAWEGLGLLFVGQYCNAPQCLYCPSHTGEHQLERYQDMFFWPGDRPIYTNYHYAGHIDLRTKKPRQPGVENGHETVLVTDGLRTAADFNHKTGSNVLRSDISVRWFEDANQVVADALPLTEDMSSSQADTLYQAIWQAISDPQSTAGSSQ